MKTSKAPKLWIDVLQVNSNLSQSVFQQLTQSIPTDWSLKIQRFKFSKDRHLSLFGKLLLLHAAKRINQACYIQENIAYNQFKRPVVDKDFDFNISHSGDYVVCAFIEKGNIGIDIEQQKQIDLNDFKSIWRGDEWQQIISAIDPIQEFYRMWTLKESIVKANGKGLYLPLESIFIHDTTAQAEKETWYLKEYNQIKDYKLAIATDMLSPEIHYSSIDMQALVKYHLTNPCRLKATSP